MAKEQHFAALQLVAMPCGLLQIVIGHVKDGRTAGYIRHKHPSVICLQKSYAVHSCSAKQSGQAPQHEQPGAIGDLATEAAADRVIEEKLLRIVRISIAHISTKEHKDCRILHLSEPLSFVVKNDEIQFH